MFVNEIKENLKVEKLIYEIREKQVMLDSDLAILYGCKNGTKSLNLAVKRNINKFPERFMFQITKEELEKLRFQFETTKNINMIRTLPYAFTEEGVAMLATILKTPVSEEISIKIMDAFVQMRHFIKNNSLLEHTINISNKVETIDKKLLEHDKKFEILFSSFNKKEQKELVYLDGQIFDSYIGILKILKNAKNQLIIIDGYADINVLEIISKLQVKVILITKTKSKITKEEIKKYNLQYNNLTIIKDDSFHDRYFLLDNKTLYHCGASLNYAGSKTFNINKLEEKEIINTLKEKITKTINNSLSIIEK